MAILHHVPKGSLLQCDFNTGFVEPEMVKDRLVIVLSPVIKARPGLVTVVALSTTAPDPIMPYHAQLDIRPPLPKGLKSNGVWVKGDMVYAVGFHRLRQIRQKTKIGRIYYTHTLTDEQMKTVHSCVLHGLGLSKLTKYL